MQAAVNTVNVSLKFPPSALSHPALLQVWLASVAERCVLHDLCAYPSSLLRWQAFPQSLVSPLSRAAGAGVWNAYGPTDRSIPRYMWMLVLLWPRQH